MNPAPLPDRCRLIACVTGHVQGVGFRWWVYSRATELSLAGRATNLLDGRVRVTAEGPRAACEELLRLLEQEPSTHRRPGRVTGVTHQWTQPRGEDGFRAY